MPNGSPLARQPPFDGQLYRAASRTWYNMRSANDNAVCSRHMAAAAAKQRTAHVTPQPKPALPVSLPLCGRQARMGLLLWYNNRKAVIIPGYAQRLAAFARQPPFDGMARAARLRPDGRLYHVRKAAWYCLYACQPTARQAMLRSGGDGLDTESGYYVYILRCADRTLYTGWTTDLERRLTMHNAGRGAKYTRARRPVTLVYCESFNGKSAAMRRECAIKRMTRAQKCALIACGDEGQEGNIT